jgi:hypothetical protein
MLFLALASAGILAATTRDARSASSPPATGRLDQVSNRGKPFSSLLPQDHRVLSQMGRAVGEISILATSGERAYYRLGNECYAAGPASPTDYTFGVIKCSAEFPTAARPVFDFTVSHSSSTDPDSAPATATLWRSEGLAADGVAKIAYVDDSGQIAAETPVVNNTYRFDTVPRTAKRLVAYDARGAELFSQPNR